MSYSTGNLAIPLPDYLFEGLASISAANNDLRGTYSELQAVPNHKGALLTFAVAVLAAPARSNSGGHNSPGEKEGQFSFFFTVGGGTAA